MYEYIIKFIIGASPRKPEVLAPAYYWTAVNIYNASPCKDATLNWKVARALPGLQVGPTSPWSTATLSRGRGFEIDNEDIDRALVLGGDKRRTIDHELGHLSHGKGFVVIRSDIELDIVAVYSASEGREHDVTLHTERVVGRKLDRKSCGTLKVNLDTNAANYMNVSSPNGGPPVPAATLTHPAWAPATGAARWIGRNNAASGLWVFERTFTIDCDGVYEVSGSMSVRSDNGSRYLLNGTEFGSTTGSYPASMPAVSLPLPPASLLRLGVNTLRVEVMNQGGPVGLLINGALAIKGAACSDKSAEAEPIESEPKEPEPKELPEPREESAKE